MIGAVLCAVPGLCVAQSMGQGALPVRFDPERFDEASEVDQFHVFFTDRELLADETWYVVGRCETAPEPASLTVVAFEHLADTTVYLTSYGYTADRQVCIVNPDDAPTAFWRAYEKRTP